MVKISKSKWGYEARVFGRWRDDVAACTAPTRQDAIDGLRDCVLGLPAGKRRDLALAAIAGHHP